jgi:hypothetical protein
MCEPFTHIGAAFLLLLLIADNNVSYSIKAAQLFVGSASLFPEHFETERNKQNEREEM